MKRGIRFLFALFLPAAGLFGGVVDAFNIGLQQPPPTVWADITDIGWYYTPSTSYTLTQIETLFETAGTDRTITFAVFTDRPANGGTLLGSATFATDEGTLGGPVFTTGIPLVGGTTYFVGLENIDGLGVNQVNYDDPDNGANGPTGSVSPGTEWQDEDSSANFGTEGCSDTDDWFCKPEIEFLEANPTGVPEPDTFVLLAVPLAVAFVRRRIRAR
jgi:hypothetical protein